MSLITPELKDRILNDLVNAGMSLRVDTCSDAPDYEIDHYTYSAILDQFEQMELLSQTKTLGGFVIANISVNAHDFVRRGGFLVQEELIKGNIQKLGLEIDLLCKELSPNLLEKAQKITAIANAILSSINFMK